MKMCREIMTADPKVCVPEDKVTVAIDIMWNYDCGCVPVVKDMNSKELVGIVTDRDIAMHVVRHACVHPNEAIVKDCMSSEIYFCSVDDPIESVIKLMCDNKVRRIPIVDESMRCVGIISQADLINNSEGLEEALISMLKSISTPFKEQISTVEEIKPLEEEEAKEEETLEEEACE